MVESFLRRIIWNNKIKKNKKFPHDLKNTKQSSEKKYFGKRRLIKTISIIQDNQTLIRREYKIYEKNHAYHACHIVFFEKTLNERKK